MPRERYSDRPGCIRPNRRVGCRARPRPFAFVRFVEDDDATEEKRLTIIGVS